jgi:hypothetical protein
MVDIQFIVLQMATLHKYSQAKWQAGIYIKGSLSQLYILRKRKKNFMLSEDARLEWLTYQ